MNCFYIIGLLILGVLVMAWFMEKSPYGWEDERGFHLGKQEDESEVDRD